MSFVFPYVLKTAKVVPVYKKDSNLDYRNYLHWKLEIRPSICIYSYPECVLEYIRHLASRIIVGEIIEDA